MSLKAFENRQYLNIETFRKNGQGVKTPVWFAQEGETLFIWTEASSGKAKRIRNNPKVNVAPSRGNGSPLGDWYPASVVCDDSSDAARKVRRLFAKKYGFAYYTFAIPGMLRRVKYTTLKVELGN